MQQNELNYKNVTRKNTEELADFFIQLKGNLTESEVPESLRMKTTVEVDTTILNFFSDNEKSVKMVWDFTNLKLLAVTKNVETIFGISLDNVQNFGDYITTVSQEHLLFLAKYTEWIGPILEEERLKKNYDYKSTLCGLIVTTKKDEKSRLLVRLSAHTFTDEGKIRTAIVSIEKINFMMKSPIVWLRMTYGKNENKVAYISTLELDGKIGDIISDREKEILKYLAEGMNTQEIAKTLFISANTIIKHRKNMLARTGLCDTTALIQICQSCGVLV